MAEDSYFNLPVKLSNHGDESYNTSLTLYYPLGLSFSKMTPTEVAPLQTVKVCWCLLLLGEHTITLGANSGRLCWTSTHSHSWKTS